MIATETGPCTGLHPTPTATDEGRQVLKSSEDRPSAIGFRQRLRAGCPRALAAIERVKIEAAVIRTLFGLLEGQKVRRRRRERN